MMEPGENWIDETYERKVELGPLPGWELPLDWTTPDVTTEKKASVITGYKLQIYVSTVSSRTCTRKRHARRLGIHTDIRRVVLYV